MSRDRTLTEASADEIDAEFELDERESTREPTGGSTDGIRGRAAERAGQLFSPKHFLAALLVTVGALFAASTFVPIPGTGLLGVFGAAFAFGLVVEERRYAEAALAGGVVTAASTLLDFAVVAFLGGFGLPIVGLSGVLGAVVGGLGTYFGRDLRDGLTRDL